MMKVVAETEIPALQAYSPPMLRIDIATSTRFADYLELTKPRIAVMALFTVAIGYLLASPGTASFVVLFHTLVGSGLVAAGGSAWNQLFERHTDGLMRRTRNRPLPAGRLTAAEAFVFGLVTNVVGLCYLLATVPSAATAAAAATLVSYAFLYTPMKKVSVWNTLVGAVPGALPPVIGWCAARGWSDPVGSVPAFLILFLWQVPHFLAIAWMYRDDYARGGLRMLPVIDPTGGRTAAAMAVSCVLLTIGSLLPVYLGSAGWAYGVGAVLCGLMFLRQALRFTSDRSDRQARRVLRASLLYLPAVLGLLLADTLVFWPLGW